MKLKVQIRSNVALGAVNAMHSGEMVKSHESESLPKLTYYSTFP